MKSKRALLPSLVCSALLAGGCAPKSPPLPKLISEVRPEGIAIPTIERHLERTELLKAVADKTSVDHVRLIPIQRGTSVQESQVPEYRIFGVRKGSVYDLLGLENTDILVAADDFIIYDPKTFPIYVTLLANQPQAKIEIRRGNQAMVFKNIFNQ